MLYNIDKDRVKMDTDCLQCVHYDAFEKKCMGLGIVCYIYDENSNVIIDSVTRLPIKINNKEK